MLTALPALALALPEGGDGVPPLVSLALIGAAGIGAQWLAWRLKLPSILLLLLAGITVGPLLDWLRPTDLFGDVLSPLVSLAVAVILYEGGLTLKVKELGEHGRAILRLLSVGVVTTWFLATILATSVAGLPLETAMVLGAILTVTGPTVIGPMLRQIRPRGPVEPIAKWEGIVVDVVGATLAVLVLHAVTESSVEGGAMHSFTTAVVDLGKTILFGSLFGVAGAYAMVLPMKRHMIPDELENAVSLAIVLGIFVASDSLAHESGLLAVTLMGFLLANRKDVSMHHIIEFKENLRVLLISTLFIVLAATVDLESLKATGWRGAAFVVLLIAVVRPASVFLSSIGTSLSRNDRVFLACLAPRGIVAAAVSSLFGLRLEAAGVPGAELLAPIAFLVIIGTVATYGLTAGPLARRLGLSDPNAQGMLIAGAGPFALELGRALHRLDIAVVHVDTNRASIARARLDGLTGVYGSILSSELASNLPLGGTGRFLGLTPNDEVNALASVQFGALYGRANVYQVDHSEGAAQQGRKDLRGRVLFREGATLASLDVLVGRGAHVKVTQLTETFDFEAFQGRYGDDAIPLGALKEGRLTLFTADRAPEAEPGAQLLSLVKRDESEGTSPAT